MALSCVHYYVVILTLQHLPLVKVNPKVYNPSPHTSTYHQKIDLLDRLAFSKKLETEGTFVSRFQRG